MTFRPLKLVIEGLEHAMSSLPDMILIKLALPDLPGDVVALKLKRMARVKDVLRILYQPCDVSIVR